MRAQRKFAEALEVDRRAAELSKAERESGPRALYPALNLGLDLEALEALVGGVAVPRRSARCQVRRRGPPEELAQVEFEVAKALRASGGDAHRARALAISARDRLSSLVAKYGQAVTDGIAEISTWLAARLSQRPSRGTRSANQRS